MKREGILYKYCQSDEKNNIIQTTRFSTIDLLKMVMPHIKNGIRYIAANNSFLLCMKGSYLFFAFIWNTIL